MMTISVKGTAQIKTKKEHKQRQIINLFLSRERERERDAFTIRYNTHGWEAKLCSNEVQYKKSTANFDSTRWKLQNIHNFLNPANM